MSLKSNKNQSQSSQQPMGNLSLPSTDVNICSILLLNQLKIFSNGNKALKLAFVFIRGSYYGDFAFIKICNIIAVIRKGSHGLQI